MNARREIALNYRNVIAARVTLSEALFFGSALYQYFNFAPDPFFVAL